jgi:hypothetical protein
MMVPLRLFSNTYALETETLVGASLIASMITFTTCSALPPLPSDTTRVKLSAPVTSVQTIKQSWKTSI